MVGCQLARRSRLCSSVHFQQRNTSTQTLAADISPSLWEGFYSDGPCHEKCEGGRILIEHKLEVIIQILHVPFRTTGLNQIMTVMIPTLTKQYLPLMNMSTAFENQCYSRDDHICDEKRDFVYDFVAVLSMPQKSILRHTFLSRNRKRCGIFNSMYEPQCWRNIWLASNPIREHPSAQKVQMARECACESSFWTRMCATLDQLSRFWPFHSCARWSVHVLLGHIGEAATCTLCLSITLLRLLISVMIKLWMADWKGYYALVCALSFSYWLRSIIWLSSPKQFPGFLVGKDLRDPVLGLRGTGDIIWRDKTMIPWILHDTHWRIMT
jgi:hypothetical protein